MKYDQEKQNELKDYIYQQWRACLKEPIGALHHKFLDPAASAYCDQQWDWDSYFCGLALIDVYEDTAEYIKGCALNFLEYMRPDGSIPYVIQAEQRGAGLLPTVGESRRSPEINSMKPLLAQMALLSCKHREDAAFLESVYPKLRRHIEHWEQTQLHENGLFIWANYRGSGTDNHPAIYGRPLNATAGVELNTFMVMEYRAMREIAEQCAQEKDARQYREKAQTLSEQINRHMWDPIDGLYYHLDVLSKKPKLATQEITWDMPLKFRTWTCFMPMYAGVALPEYAERMVKEHLINPDEFWSEYGVRTLAKNEKMYSTAETSNPSNWQGPIWILPTYLIYCGLMNYGYEELAEKLAQNIQTTLLEDIARSGTVHEYYDPETGESSINPGFLNWNALAGCMQPRGREIR